MAGVLDDSPAGVLPTLPKPATITPVAQTPAVPAPAAAPLPAAAGPVMRDFADVPAMRRSIYDSVLTAARGIEPIQNARHTLQLADVDWADPEDVRKRDRKRAILRGETLGRRLRGTWRLVDNATGATLDERKTTLATVPVLTDGGTFVMNGTEYTLANQMRLRPGIFTRRKHNGEVESHVNILPGKGVSHRYTLDPERSTFKIGFGQAQLPLLPVLRAMGATEMQLREAWGDDVLGANLKGDDPRAVDKLVKRLIKETDGPDTPDNRRAALAKVLGDMHLDPEVTKRTLGTGFDRLSVDSILASTKRILAVHKGEQEPDDRDALAYQNLLGPEDLFAERLRNAHKALRPLLWKATFKQNLSPLGANFLDKHVKAAITASGLGQPLEEVNPADLLSQITRVSRLGEGGIPSIDSVPEEARNVQPSHFGYVDPLLTPESFKVGVDSRLAFNARKGTDGKVYSQFLDPKSGEKVWRTPQDVADMTIAFPGELRDPKKGMVAALQGGKLKYVPRDKVDLTMPNMESAFNPLANMIPLKSTIKGQRVMMGARMLTQALPLANPQAPFVQAGMPDQDDRSFEEEYGKYMGAVRADVEGQVVQVTPDEVHVKGPDGKVQVHELHNNLPFNRKTFLHNTPTVAVGDVIKKGDLLARSNYTDEKGATALGLNLRVAYLPYKGLNFEDAIVISQAAAKRLASEHMYQHDTEWEENTKRGKRTFLSLFPAKFDRKALDTLDDDGIVTPGTRVEEGHPLVLQAKAKDRAHNQIVRGKDAGFGDSTITWDHHDPGVVTDVEKTDKGVVVTVKSLSEMKVGDKLCYDSATEVLTANGWKPVAEVGFGDRVASLDPATGLIEYVNPVETHVYDHVGRMYRLKTTQADLLVTDNHNLYAMPRGRDGYGLYEARDLFGRRYRLKRDGVWEGESPEFVELPPMTVRAGQSGNGARDLPAVRVPARTYAMLLGMFLSEGSLVDQPKSGSFGFDVTQIKECHRTEMLDALRAAGVKFNEHGVGTKVRVYGKQWLRHFRQFGAGCADKFIPAEVFEWGRDLLQVLFDWLVWGDGHVGKTQTVYTTTSRRLAGDVQRLCLHLGTSANVKTTPARAGVIKGKPYRFRERYDVYVYRSKNAPEVNHGHVRSQAGQTEEWIDYEGKVYCVTLPRNHVMYVRRNGKPVWCGNSGRYGDKGVIAHIIPDEEMPRDKDGKPYEVLANPLGIITRTNPGQMVEAALGKIAERTGKRYAIKDFDNIDDMVEMAIAELGRHGIPDTEDIEDPVTQRKIAQVFTGNRFFMKLHHTSESKGQGRGLGGYTNEETPAKGGETGSKRISLMDINALLSHGAHGVLRDAGAVRGQKNQDYWAAFMAGKTPPEPKVPLVYRKFLAQLQSAGINPVARGSKTQVMALTDRDIDEMAMGREVTNAETVDWKDGLKPVSGGLFDNTLTGGHGGNRWAFIRLHEPMPNPVMEEPIRRVLGLTAKKFEEVMTGKAELNGMKGPPAIASALKRIDVQKGIDAAEAEFRSGKRSSRDQAVRKLALLKHAQRLGVHPGDWVMNKVPVLPPAFRPVSVMGSTGRPMVSDPNYLYKDLFESNQALKDMSRVVDDVGTERLNLYKSFKAVTGLGDPTNPKLVERKVKGVLRYVFGDNPKFGVVQRKLLGSTVDTVGRAVITPNPELDMDQVGLPESKAWEIYKPFVIRRLARRGVPPLRAAEMVKNNEKMAMTALQDEMEERPVILTRAPVLHRYGTMAFKPRLVKGETLQVPPLIVKGFAADFDGDAMNYHVPTSDNAVKDALEKMLPSRNLLAVKSFKVHQLPQNEYQGGLYEATTKKADKPERYFENKAAMMRALRRGEISADQKVVILN